MTQIKEKKIRISSVIENLSSDGFAEGEAERSESTSLGFFKISEDEYNLTCAEDTEGGRLVTDIVITDNTVRVKRTGAIESEMIFKEGMLHKSIYSIPPYSFDAEIMTRKIRSSMRCDGGRVDIFYSMKIGGAEKYVKMRIEC